MKKNNRKSNNVPVRILLMCLALMLLASCLPTCLADGSGDAVNVIAQHRYYPTWTDLDIVTFGEYEQDGSRSNGAEPIEWYVAYERNGLSLLVSVYALDWMLFNDMGSLSSYMDSSLMQWLNYDFFDTAFTSDEQSSISNQTGLHGVFLLSLYEVEKYLPNKAARTAVPTVYAINKGANKWNGGGSWWWTSDTYEENGLIVVKGVTGNGSRDNIGQVEDHNRRAVRPAIWVESSAIGQ